MWSHTYRPIEFKCDGYELTLQPMIYKMKLIHAVYVNGWMKGEWLNGECEECRRFFRVKESFCYSAKDRASAKKHLSKSAYRKYNFDKKWKAYFPDWYSFSSFKKHLTANNKEIELIKQDKI